MPTDRNNDRYPMQFTRGYPNGRRGEGWDDELTSILDDLAVEVPQYGPLGDRPSTDHNFAPLVYCATDQDPAAWYVNTGSQWVLVADGHSRYSDDEAVSAMDGAAITPAQLGDATDPVGSSHVRERSQGSNPADTIDETSSPTSFTFSAGQDRDLHTSTDVTISNGSTSEVTEDITVEYYDGTDTTGTLVDDETQSVTVASGGSTTTTFLASVWKLDTGDYHISITTSGTTLSIDQTDEHTLGAEYTTEQTATGDRRTTDVHGNVVRETDSATGEEYIPNHRSDVSNVRELSTNTQDADYYVFDDAGTIKAIGQGDLSDFSDTDFQTAVQNAIDALDANSNAGYGGTVHITRGQYLVSAPIELHHRVKLVGDGWWSTLLKLADGVGDNLIQAVIPSSGSERSGQGIRDIHLQGNKANNTSGHCVLLDTNNAGQTADDGFLERCWIANAPQDGIHIEEGHVWSFSTVVVGANARHGFYAADRSQNFSNCYYFDEGNATGPAVKLAAGARFCKLDWEIQNPAGAGVVIDDNQNRGDVTVQSAGGDGVTINAGNNDFSVHVGGSANDGVIVGSGHCTIDGWSYNNTSSDVVLESAADGTVVSAKHGSLAAGGGLDQAVVNGHTVGNDATPEEVTTSRSEATWYRNTTGRPLEWSLTIQASNTSEQRVIMDVNGDQTVNAVNEIRHNGHGSGDRLPVGSVTIPEGHYYQMRDVNGNSSMTNWTEYQV